MAGSAQSASVKWVVEISVAGTGTLMPQRSSCPRSRAFRLMAMAVSATSSHVMPSEGGVTPKDSNRSTL
jgi:hypothetical protein